MYVSSNWWRIDLALNPIDSASLSERDVIVYTTSWCPYCAKLKRYLETAGIPYTEYDVEKSDAAYREYERISGMGVPVTQIGKEVINGYDLGSLKQAISKLSSQNQTAMIDKSQ